MNAARIMSGVMLVQVSAHVYQVLLAEGATNVPMAPMGIQIVKVGSSWYLKVKNHIGEKMIGSY